ncbi:DUF4265 domain-containing protein [Streptomyces sp. NPDC007206]|uniref:DUF4265 domain-containing protein n=1 Tax=Streptomyces sp. NPDC007206 TaxID=3154317 RepID=UPI0033E1095C
MHESTERPISANGAKLFKVAFDLTAERPNWPPVSVERLWGEKTGVKFEIRIVNIPFFARGIAFGDLVRVRPDNERRELVFDEFTRESGHSTVRIITLRQEFKSELEARLAESGCSWELAPRLENYMAVDIPSTVEYRELREWLISRTSAGEIEIQESAISKLHQRQLPNFP